LPEGLLLGQSLHEVSEVLTRESPLEGPGRLLVVALEGQQSLLDLVEVCEVREWDKVWEVARSGVTPGVAMPELNEAAARKSSNPANPRTGQHGSANSCLPRFVPLSNVGPAPRD